MKKLLYIACDHAAFEAKESLKKVLSQEYEVKDLGTHSNQSVHYPTYAQNMALEIQGHSEARGILLCGSGIGVSMTVNRFKGIRGALCRDSEDAKMSRLHNNANVLCLGARRNSMEELIKITETFLNTSFEGGRHQDRVNLFDSLGC